MLNRGGPLSKLVGGTIGLAKEYSADRKERKAAVEGAAHQTHSSQTHQASESNQRPFSEGHEDGSSSDEEEWVLDLDEAQESTNPHSTANSQNQAFDAHEIVQKFPRPTRPAAIDPLSSPVLLPQRRPKSQHKGFVRAYAPILNQCEIDQHAWLQFLDGLEKSVKKNSWFHVTNAATMMAGSAAALTLGISPILHMASMALHASIEVSRRGYQNYQQNNYLDIMNEQLFKPRGLYCMIIKYKVSSNEILEDVDLNQNISRSIQGRDEQSKWKNLVFGSSMTLKTEVEMPTPAPLIFPGLDNMDEHQKTNALKRFGHVLGDYQDRRAAATFEAEHPESKMPAAPRKEFASPYGDPNSAVNSGGFISMATGGKVNPVGPAGARHDMRRERLAARKDRRKQKKEKRPMNKVLKSEALYLLVTNLPSQEILEKVAEQMERGQ